jgi:NAD(P) transhydrogenase subunit alpha
MYAKNIATLLLHLVKDKQLNLDLNDEITRETLVTRDGQIVHPRVAQAVNP